RDRQEGWTESPGAHRERQAGVITTYIDGTQSERGSARERTKRAFDPIPITIHPRFPLTRLGPDLSSAAVRGNRALRPPCTDERTTGVVVEGRVVDDITAPLVAGEWEDITAYLRTALPDAVEPYRLCQRTRGRLWKVTPQCMIVA